MDIDKRKEYSGLLEQTIDFHEIFLNILEKKWVIVASMVIGLIIGFVYNSGVDTQYRVDASAKIITSSKSSNSMLMPAFYSQDQLAAQKKIITSREVLEGTVSDLNQNIVVTPSYFPLVGAFISRSYEYYHENGGPSPPWFYLERYSWGNDHIVIDEFDASGSLSQSNITLVAGENSSFKILKEGELLLEGKTGERVSVTTSYGSLTVNVREITARPYVHFNIKIIPVYVSANKLRSAISFNAQERGVNNILEVLLNTHNPEVGAETLNHIIKKAIDLNTKINSEQAMKTLEFLREQVPKIVASLELAQENLSEYQAKNSSLVLSQNGGLLEESISSIGAQVRVLEIKRTALSMQYTDGSPQIQEIDRQIAQLKLQESKVMGDVKLLPREQQKAINLKTNVKIQQEIYSNLLSNIQANEIAEASVLSQIAIIDKASPDPFIIKGPGLKNILAGGVLGAVIGLIIAVMKSHFRNEVRDPQVIEQQYSFPLLGMLYESEKMKQENDSFKNKSLSYLKFMEEIDHYDVSLESVRSLMTALKFNLVEGKKIITISGPSPQVGKSYLAANLSQVFATHGQRVLLIDADVRRGHLRDYFNESYIPGLVEFLDNKAEEREVVRKTRFENLEFIPSGSHNRKNYLSLFSSNKFNEVLDKFRDNYDVIIIDSAPVLATSDASNIFQKSDISLIVFGYDMHTPKEINLTLKQLKNVNVIPDGYIFNRIPTSTGKYGYYGKGYGYGYGYKSRYQYRYRYDSNKENYRKGPE